MSMTNILVGINIAIYVLDRLLGQPGAQAHWLMDSLASGPVTLTKPWLWWQFLTAGFAHDPLGFRHIGANMFMLWMFGRDVERRLGKWEFLRVYLVAIVLGNLLFAVRQYFLVEPANWNGGWGASGAVTAIFVLFVCYFPTRTLLLFFVIPTPAWVVGLLLIGWNVLGVFSPPPPPPPPGVEPAPRIAYDVHLTGAALAFAYWRLGWNLRWLATPFGWLAPLAKWFRRPKLKLHNPESTYVNQDAEADRVLAKLHNEGEASLTAKERRVLEDYSRRMRQKLR
jgi:membrane associated rhomboid family serine protease